MNFEFGEQINPDLENLNFEKAIGIAQAELRKLPNSEFHSVLDNSLVGQAYSLAFWIENFYSLAAKKNKVEALYFEMNEFDINTDEWYIDGFAYCSDGGLNDMEWLCDFDSYSQAENAAAFKIEGYEDLQYAFENVELSTVDLQNARDWCEQIVIARFMELMASAHTIAKTKKFDWATVPIYFTEHSYDFVVKSDK